MSAASFPRFIPSLEGPRNAVRELWDRLHRLPGGKLIFSRLIGRMAPYTGNINARVLVLRRGHSEVKLDDRRPVRNHLNSVHAVALVNLAELTGNLALAYSLPDDARFIVAGLSMEYLKKARGTITAITDLKEIPQTSERREYAVPVSLRDRAGDEVARCTLRTLVGPKK